MEYFKLNNGMRIPAVGFGVYLIPSKEVGPALKEAFKDGYRLIDTANAYLNEVAVGQAIKASGLKREEIFLTTKLWPSEYENAKAAIAATLKRLDTPYIDLLLLHQSIGNYLAAWKVLEEAVDQGLVKAIGISNFTVERYADLLKHARIIPAVSQDEFHPFYPSPKLKDAFRKEKVVMESWYPLGHGDQALIEAPIFGLLGKKYHKTNAQIILRWHYQMGNVTLPKSLNPIHIKENLGIFDFALTKDEMTAIAKLDRGYPYYPVGDAENEKRLLQWNPNFEEQH